MVLKVKDRIQLLNVLPGTGSIVTLKIVRALRERLSFSEDDIKTFGIKESGEMINWEPSSDTGTEIEIGEKAHEIIVDAFKTASSKGELTLDMVDLYDKFVTQ